MSKDKDKNIQTTKIVSFVYGNYIFNKMKVIINQFSFNKNNEKTIYYYFYSFLFILKFKFNDDDLCQMIADMLYFKNNNQQINK